MRRARFLARLALHALLALFALLARVARVAPKAPRADLDARLPIKLSQVGFALQADLCYTSRLGGSHDARAVNGLRHGDRIFISVGETSVSIAEIVAILRRREIKLVFFLMDEPVVAPEILAAVYPVAIRTFVQNSAYDVPNVHIMPIGIRCSTRRGSRRP